MIKSKSTRIGDFVVVALCLILIFVCLVPMLNVLARSLSSTEYLIPQDKLQKVIGCASMFSLPTYW